VVMESNIIQAWLSFFPWYLKLASIPFRLDPLNMERDDTPLDFVAFRESFLNVLCHQDYQDHTRKPEIRHFADRTIFWNPGDAFAKGNLLERGLSIICPLHCESCEAIDYQQCKERLLVQHQHKR
jgi:ATP-dependent DNA helicase RecG